MSCSDDDEIIETSDTDERDALHALDHSYWQRAANDIRARRGREVGDTDTPSPRKRVKVCSFFIIILLILTVL
jgi:hypothetical protein